MCRHRAVGGTAARHIQIAVPEAVAASGERHERRRLIRLDGGDGALEHRLRLLGRAGIASRNAFMRRQEQTRHGHAGDQFPHRKPLCWRRSANPARLSGLCAQRFSAVKRALTGPAESHG
jgi:hypothetical protein